MRKETYKIAEAWWFKRNAGGARTMTDGKSVYLHGNRIAWREEGKNGYTRSYNFTLAGWPTVTTRERLNGILNIMGGAKAGFHQEKGVQYFTDLTGKKRAIEDDEIVTIYP